ncbi:hypothetical protein [Maritalea sp.]|uniref:hypothetical protein n=1 Tax=Maritalea sp. TaxID=2003361 RepID=UPI003EFAF9F0
MLLGYGKSIARDKAEHAVGDLIKTVQPTQNLVALVKVMFRNAWNQRHEQTDALVASIKDQTKKLDQQIDAIVERLMTTSNSTVIARYEQKIEELESDKARFVDQITHIKRPKQDSYNEKLELPLQIITKPWKLWVSGNINLRRLVLKLVFADRLEYDRKLGARTPLLTLPFKALSMVQGGVSKNGAG